MTTKNRKTVTASAPPALIGNKKLQAMYEAMLKCRIVESHAKKYSGGASTAKGREAAVVGLTIDLLPHDAVVSSSGAAAVSFIKGTSLDVIFGQLHAHSLDKKKTRPKSPAYSKLAGYSGIATGMAFANRSRDKNKSVTVAFFAEEAEPASWQEVLCFASTHKLPIIYACDESAVDEILGQSCGLPVIPVDGNDVVAVYRVAHECITRARLGGGPSLIVCKTFPLEIDSTKSQDPLRNMERYLIAKGLFIPGQKQQIIHAFEKKVERAITTGKKTKRRERRSLEFDRVVTFR
jgi:pyruvate dehydrogenase E1 component alpha subunit